MLGLIAAVSTQGVIGYQGTLPWSLPIDLAYFKACTFGKHLIMGRKTFESLPGLLPHRTHWVLTRDRHWSAPDVVVWHDWEAMRNACPADDITWVIGGEALYTLALPYVDRLHLTHVHADVKGDTYFPTWDATDWRLISRRMYPHDHRHTYPFSVCVYGPKSMS